MFTADEWKIKIEEFKQSGMPQVAWCQAQGIKYHLFKHRLYPKVKKQTSTKPIFKELKPQGLLRIKWHTITLEISPDFDEATLKRFLKALS
jgi:hypothetical protein